MLNVYIVICADRISCNSRRAYVRQSASAPTAN